MLRSNSSTGLQRAGAVLLLAVLILLGGFLAMPQPVHADSGGYTTTSYAVRVDTDADHTFHVSEEIDVDFSAPRHGIYRYIPQGEKFYGIRNIDVQGDHYETYTEGDSQVVQIGRADTYVTGPHTYRISYDIVGYRDNDETKDMLSLDLLPTGWSTPIQSASVSLHLPQPIEDFTTYAGAYGQTESGDTYFDIRSDGSTITAVSKELLPQGLGLTISADLPQGYWVNPYSRDDRLPICYGLLGVMGMLMLLLWVFVGRDDPIITTVEFYPPEDMDPLEVAYVANNEVPSKQIGALFMYLANKGVLEIAEEGKKRFRLIRKGDLPPGESEHTRELFKAAFSGSSEVRMDKLPERFGKVAMETASIVKRVVEERQPTFSSASRVGRIVGLAFCFLIPLAAGGAYAYLNYEGAATIAFVFNGLICCIAMASVVGKTDAFRARKRPVRIIVGFIIFLASVAMEAAFIVVEYPLLALIFVCSVLAAAIATIFVRRRMNNELYGRVLGFRDFIRTAEYDRLKMLSDENPSYYFNIMPYAFVFGMSTKWADKFANFPIPQPSWYHSASGVYDPYFPHYVMVHTGGNIHSSVMSQYKAVGEEMFSSDSGGGGSFGGGGFSGGGFGGGGGGSW